MRLLVRLRVDLSIAALLASLFKEPASSQERRTERAAIRRRPRASRLDAIPQRSRDLNRKDNPAPVGTSCRGASWCRHVRSTDEGG